MNVVPLVASAKTASNKDLMGSKSAIVGWEMITPTPLFDGDIYEDA